jgi:hypothetical protein
LCRVSIVSGWESERGGRGRQIMPSGDSSSAVVVVVVVVGMGKPLHSVETVGLRGVK